MPEVRCFLTFIKERMMTNRFKNLFVVLLALFFLLGVTGNAAFASGVDVNTASVKELTQIPGIGKVTAESIVTERTENGSFTDLADLQKRVKGIGPKTAEKIKDSVSFSETLAVETEKAEEKKE